MKSKYSNDTLRNDFEAWKDIKKELMAMIKNMSEPGLDDKYFYMKTQEKLLKMLCEKKLIIIPDL